MTKDDIDRRIKELKEPSKEHQWHNIHRGDYEENKADNGEPPKPPKPPVKPKKEPEEEKTGLWKRIREKGKKFIVAIGVGFLGIFGFHSCEKLLDPPTTPETTPDPGTPIMDPQPPETPTNPQPTKDDIKIGDTITVDLDGTETYYYDATGSQPSGKLQDDTVVISGVAIVGKDGKVVENYFSSIDPKEDARRNTCRGRKRISREA